MAKHIVATVDEIPPGERKVIEVAGRTIGVFNINGDYFAIRNNCPHQGGPLCSGRLTGFIFADKPGKYTYTRRGEILRCPWHGWEFDVKTGQSWFDPAKTRVRTYPVTVEVGPPPDEVERDKDELGDDGVENQVKDGLQPGPYIAETYDVRVEQQFVVVEVPGR